MSSCDFCTTFSDSFIFLLSNIFIFITENYLNLMLLIYFLLRKEFVVLLSIIKVNVIVLFYQINSLMSTHTHRVLFLYKNN